MRKKRKTRKKSSKTTTPKKKKKVKPIEWGTKARYLSVGDICRGKATWGKKRDIQGWMIEFFGESTRPRVAFEQYFCEKLGILAHMLVIWSDDATMGEQVKLFNETLDDLKVLPRKRR